VKVVCLSGGVGGAKLAAGLYDVLPPGALTVIGNVGDDLEVLGLHVSPDLDSVLYALAGLNDTERGWGRADETWRTLGAATAWGGEGWFLLGDLDLGLHLVRTQALRDGTTLAGVTAQLVETAGLVTRLLPVTNDRVRTHVETPAGMLPFQEWFVARRHADEVDAVVYEGVDAATPAPGVLDAIAGADRIVFAPSNPYVSLLPILRVAGVSEAIRAATAPRVGVSPLVGGRAVRGPLDRMLQRMAGSTTPAAFVSLYDGLLDALVVDPGDVAAPAPLALRGAEIVMPDREAARSLARVVLEIEP
jgi:LPPG:FO 2-phospho-L-lactate transferase